MSAAPRRKDHKRPKPQDRKRKPSPPASGLQPAVFNRQPALVVCALAVFAGIPFVVGKYLELKQPDPFDSGCYVYSAQHVLSGARIGYEEKPSAQAGTLLVNMFGVTLSGFNETGSKLLQGLFQAVALAFMFLTVRRLYGSLAAVVGVIIASVYLSAPVIAKFGNVKEQFMIALMILGICSFVWYHLDRKWWWAVLTGALLIGGPLFKQTGVSAIAAVGLFTLAQPILHRYAWKKAGVDILLLVAGAAITMTPIFLWYASMRAPLYYWPYSWAAAPVLKLAGVEVAYTANIEDAPESLPQVQDVQEVEEPAGSFILRLLPGYVSDSWRLLGPEQRWGAAHRVFRYYRVLILPIALAVGAILARIVMLLRTGRTNPQTRPLEDPGRFVLLFAIWWFFDMTFVFISPHSYEQYYLPLNGSSAVLGSYLVGLYAYRLRKDRETSRWIVLGLLGLLLMLVLSWPIFFGIARSPHSGVGYTDSQGQPIRRNGYVQRWREVTSDLRYPWIEISNYIRANSDPNDPLYVWGWFPGIYVQAQRMSPTPKAFEGTMHMLPPQQLAERVLEILTAFERNPPRFIVDTRKIHFPFNRPPLELWPRMQQGFLPPDEERARQFDELYANHLRENIDPAEALRYDVMRPLRWYVMTNYDVVADMGGQVLFRRK